MNKIFEIEFKNSKFSGEVNITRVIKANNIKSALTIAEKVNNQDKEKAEGKWEITRIELYGELEN